MSELRRWWKDATFYQVYPASFKDSNEDGLGDIQGVISKLDYIHDLGIDTIWLSPHYASPQIDMGYDISDYEDIHRPYGTVADCERLISEVHARGMRIIFDLVINHTSDQHAWFLESRKSRDNPKANWYIWRDAKYADGKKCPPNNWRAEFGGCAWEWSEERQQYYLHLFEKEMPDLNWDNTVTREAIYDSAIRSWLKKGVDGFRVDTANLYCKDTLEDAEVKDPEAEYQQAFELYCNGSKIHDYYQDIRKNVLDEFGDVVMVGELPRTDLEDLMKYVAEERRELNMVFDFAVVLLGGNWTLPKHEVQKHSLPELKTAFMKTQALVKGTSAWTTVFLENHDLPRSVSRFATDDPQYREKAGKVLAMLLATLSGTLFIYQGQELGMTNIPATWSIDDCRDVDAINYWRRMEVQYKSASGMLDKAWSGIRFVGRDNARTPMQWSSEANGGFTSSKAKPWMRVNDNYVEVNVEKQLQDDDSLLSFWRKMLTLRKQYADVFIYGEFLVHDQQNDQIFVYEKKAERGGAKALVVLNFSDDKRAWSVPDGVVEGSGGQLETLISNGEAIGGAAADQELEAWEGRVFILRGSQE